jgi:hypothetical protein
MMTAESDTTVVLVEKRYLRIGISMRSGTPERVKWLSRWLSPLRIKVWPRLSTASLVTESFWKAVGWSGS